MDTAILLIRLLVGCTLICHAVQKGFGWLHGPGLARSAEIFESLGQQPGRMKVRLAMACELGSGLLLLAGMATPFAAAVAAGTMIVAGGSMTMKGRTFWNAAGGGEYPFVLSAVALCLGFSGAGAYSVDAFLWDDQPWFTGVVVLVVAAAAAAPALLQSHRSQAGGERNRPSRTDATSS